MAIQKSTIVINQESASHGSDHSHGMLKGFSTVATSTAALADDSVIPFERVSVDANILSFRLGSTDHGTTGAVNLGVYRGDVDAGDLDPADASIVVDEDCLATAIDVNTAAVAHTENRYEVQAITTCGKKLWEVAGLSARPDYDHFWVAGTLSAATTAAGTFAVDCIYV